MAAGLGVLAVGVAVWWLPPVLYSEKDSDARAALQSGLLTVAAALLALAGGLVALAETRLANERTHVRELYTHAVDQLGSEKLDVRLGGVYALERIAFDSPADQAAVVAVLGAFIREQTIPGRSGASGRPQPDPREPDADIQASLTVLGAVPHRRGVRRGDLRGAVIGGADLTDADLTAARLDAAKIAHGTLVRAVLREAELGGAILTHVRLDGANLSGADLSGAIGLTQAQVDTALGNGATKLPVGLSMPASWPA